MMSKYEDMFLYFPESGHEGACMHESGSSQNSIRNHQAVCYVDVQEFDSFSKEINHASYFFGQPRPPEQPIVACTKFLTWDNLCLKESGWGPPALQRHMRMAH